jgi:hypothetical protein
MDAAKNFAKSTLASGIAAGATTLSVASGGGAKFPSAPFNAVIWNSTDYADPSDDPTHEVVRVTAVSTDTLTITRGQESTSDSAHNTAGKTYKIAAPLTAGMLQQIYSKLPIVSVTNSQFNKTNNTMADVPGLSVPLQVGTYVVRMYIPTQLSDGAGGFDVGGTCTIASASMFIYDANTGSMFTYEYTPGSLYTMAVNLSAPETHVLEVFGTIVVSVAGTLTARFAQDATNATASSVMAGASIVALQA